MIVATALPASADVLEGQAGESHVSICAVSERFGSGVSGRIQFQDLDGQVKFVMNVRGATPGAELEIRSGVGNNIAWATVNRGGNAHFAGTTDDWKARFNVWPVGATETEDQLAWTDKDSCVTPTPYPIPIP